MIDVQYMTYDAYGKALKSTSIHPLSNPDDFSGLINVVSS